MFSAKKQPFSAVKSAFTLIELMVVMGLMVMIHIVMIGAALRIVREF